jgi:hypothetical protein
VGLSQVSLRYVLYLAYFKTHQLHYMSLPYCSISHLVMTVLMGCSQAYPNRQLDTGIPFITSNIVLPFKILPLVYMFTSLLSCFLLELPLDWRLPLSFLFLWLTMRLFLRTRAHTDL